MCVLRWNQNLPCRSGRLILPSGMVYVCSYGSRSSSVPIYPCRRDIRPKFDVARDFPPMIGLSLALRCKNVMPEVAHNRNIGQSSIIIG